MEQTETQINAGVYVKNDDIWYAVLVERDEIDSAYHLYHPEAMPPEKVGVIVETH